MSSLNLCQKCFNDKYIQGLISNSSKVGICDICGESGQLIGQYEIIDFFDDLFQLFQKDSSSSKTISSLIQEEWNIFSDERTAETIIAQMLIKTGSSLLTTDSVSLLPTITTSDSIWDDIKNKVKKYSRFLVDASVFEDNYIQFDRIRVKKGQRFYRARITPKDIKKMTPKKMECPPADKATPGRANPLGIPYLYLSKEVPTTFYEIRAGFLDKVGVGTFVLKKDLDIIDFDSNRSIVELYYNDSRTLAELITNKRVLRAISSDLSKPLRRYDTELEYVPTQWICEYCKIKLGADGICFKSSLHKGGQNYVLFNPSDAKCTRAKEYEIKQIDINGDLYRP